MLKFLFNKVAGLKACNFIKKRPQQKCFPVNITKVLRTAFLQNTSGGCICNPNKHRHFLSVKDEWKNVTTKSWNSTHMDLKVNLFNKELASKFNISSKSIVVNLTLFVPASFLATAYYNSVPRQICGQPKYKIRFTMKKGEINHILCNCMS